MDKAEGCRVVYALKMARAAKWARSGSFSSLLVLAKHTT